MSEYRLDDLIREGAEISDKAITDMIRRNGDQVKSCAYGAAQLGLEKKEGFSTENQTIVSLHNIHNSLWLMSETEISIKHIPDYILNRYNSLGNSWGLYEVIYTMNDSFEKSRKFIAEYVGWLIDEKGYDLTVDLSPDEDDQEEEEEERELQPA